MHFSMDIVKTENRVVTYDSVIKQAVNKNYDDSSWPVNSVCCL